MKAYETKSIRNVGIAGHGDTGKTQLVSSLLFTAGMTTRLGKVSEGTTVTDWDEEEIARKISIHTSLAYAEWAPSGQSGKGAAAEKIKINFLDTPGYSTFLNDTRASLVAADAVLIVVDAAAGVQVGTEKVWDYGVEYDLPRAFCMNWMDRELANYDRAMESLTRVFGRNVVALQLPIGSERGFRGVIDLITMKAHFFTPDGDGKPKIEDIPEVLAETAKAAHEALVEKVAEGEDDLMAEFFEKGTLPIEDLMKGLREEFQAKTLYPVVLTCALHNIGSATLLDLLANVFPDPSKRGTAIGHSETASKGAEVQRTIGDAEPLSIFVFKTLADPFAGRVTYFKVMSGVLKNDAMPQNFTRGTSERLQHIQVMQGKTA
ncbi:MAG TPA: GTP-binding protein, partial [Candidatus Acidoferrales bacterium]|nr:GTP-binding protein [Candidatus Acidoferrales bacterium]